MTESTALGEMVRAAQAGDEASFAALVAEYQDIAVAYATSVVGDYHLAEDVAQEAFVDAHRALSTLREAESFAGWFRRIVFKHCDRATRGKQRSMVLAGLNAAVDVASDSPSPHDVVARMIRPRELETREPLLWSTGMGSDVWELFCACITGDLDQVTRLIAADPSLVRAHYEYRTPLSFAVKENQIEVAKFLLEHGADALALGNVLDVARWRGYADMVALLEREFARIYGASTKGEPVAQAIRDRDRKKVRQLLDGSPELVHEGDQRSSQPIHWAVMTRNLDIIDDLLARGADINARRQDGALPIHLTNGDYHYRGWRDVSALVRATPDDVYRHLVERGSTIDIGMAAATGNLARVKELLDRDAELVNRPNDYNSYYVGCGTPLKNAASGGHMEIVKLLLERGANPNTPEEGIAPHGHALYAAVYNGHYEIAKLLLEHGAYPNPEVESSADAVYIAIMRGDLRMVELLGEYGAIWEIPVDKGRPLSYEQVAATRLGRSMTILAAYGDVATAAVRLAQDPSLANEPEALSRAANHGHEDFVRLLLRYQPDLATRVTVGKPRAMAELLFAHGMDPNRPNWLRQQPLHHIAQRGDVDIAALFLEHGADIDARDEEFRTTPLGYAAWNGKTKMVKFLLERGARPSLPDDPPWAAPLEIAKFRNHAGVVKILSRQGSG